MIEPKSIEAPLPQLINAKAAAAALGIGRTTLYWLTKNRQLACVHVGRRVLFDPKDLADFIARSRGGARR
ncbi:MAG: helix-turn-helix domain-containing protein [Phycisphaeraceae bacterium]|nr:helix-turn-helix domain-containing protein [Phycisphaeraceae bacterium]